MAALVVAAVSVMKDQLRQSKAEDAAVLGIAAGVSIFAWLILPTVTYQRFHGCTPQDHKK